MLINLLRTRRGGLKPILLMRSFSLNDSTFFHSCPRRKCAGCWTNWQFSSHIDNDTDNCILPPTSGHGYNPIMLTSNYTELNALKTASLSAAIGISFYYEICNNEFVKYKNKGDFFTPICVLFLKWIFFCIYWCPVIYYYMSIFPTLPLANDRLKRHDPNVFHCKV